jgi:hypothetical protein
METLVLKGLIPRLATLLLEKAERDVVTVSRRYSLYPNLSQCVELRAQTAQSQPNVIYTYQWFRGEPRRNHPS